MHLQSHHHVAFSNAHCVQKLSGSHGGMVVARGLQQKLVAGYHKPPSPVT
jgi:hypothetical protein